MSNGWCYWLCNKKWQLNIIHLEKFLIYFIWVSVCHTFILAKSQIQVKYLYKRKMTSRCLGVKGRFVRCLLTTQEIYKNQKVFRKKWQNSVFIVQSIHQYFGDWSGNNFFSYSLPSADTRNAVATYWQKNCTQSTGPSCSKLKMLLVNLLLNVDH